MLKVYVIHQWCSTQVTLSIQRNGARRAWTSPHPELKPWHDHACSLVELLGLLVKSRALLDCDKALETQCLPCLGDGSNPSALLAKRRLLLAHDLAVLVLSTRVVSMPCMERFERQSAEYKAEILPGGVKKIAMEAGVSGLWYKYADTVVGVDKFGMSAPGDFVMDKYGMNADTLVKAAR